MKTEIEKLIELAKDYVVFGTEIGLPQTHNHIRGGYQEKPEFHKEGDLINIYFANNFDTWQVEFKNIKVIGYANEICIPLDADKEYLSEVHKSALDYLNNHLLPNVAKFKIATLKERHVEIKKLEKKLRQMKGLI